MYPTNISFFLTRDTRSIWATPRLAAADPRRKAKKKSRGGGRKVTAPAEIFGKQAQPLSPAPVSQAQAQPLCPCALLRSLLPAPCHLLRSLLLLPV